MLIRVQTFIVCYINNFFVITILAMSTSIVLYTTIYNRINLYTHWRVIKIITIETSNTSIRCIKSFAFFVFYSSVRACFAQFNEVHGKKIRTAFRAWNLASACVILCTICYLIMANTCILTTVLITSSTCWTSQSIATFSGLNAISDGANRCTYITLFCNLCNIIVILAFGTCH